MNNNTSNEISVIVVAATVLGAIGVAAILGISYLRPMVDNMTLDGLVLGFVSTIFIQFLGYLKSREAVASSAENRKAIEEVKKNTNGMTTQLVANATTVATLTEKIESANKAADVAKQTAVDTAVALAAKTATMAAVIVDTNAVLKENGIAHKEENK
jgi:hypothetical protein